MKRSKSSLLSALQRAHRISILSGHQPERLEGELAQYEQSSTQYDRRRFLGDMMKAGLILGMPAMLQSCNTDKSAKQPPLSETSPTGIAENVRVAIVGGGIAGLTAAYYLKKSGINATIYEASKRIGGRMFTSQNLFAENTTTELGGEFVDSSHEDMIKLCKELIGPDWFLDTQSPTEKKLIKDDYFINGIRYNERQVIKEFRQYSKRIAADIASLPDEISYKTKNPVPFDKMSVEEYLKKIGMSGWIYDLMNIAYTSEFGLEIGEQNAINFLWLFNPDTSNGFQIFGESDERYKIKGGNIALLNKLEEQLKDQIEWEYNLESIAPKGTGTSLTFQNGKVVQADFVLLAIPFSVLRGVKIGLDMSPVKKACIEGLEYGTNGKLFMGFNNRLWRDQGFSGYLFNNAIQNGWDGTQLQNNNQGQGSYTVFLGGKSGKNVSNDQQSQFLTALDAVFKGANSAYNGKFGVFNWTSNSFAQGSYACYRPGQFTSIMGAESEPVGNVYFAGEHCSSEYQGYMNGGAETGRVAAERIVLQVKKG